MKLSNSHYSLSSLLALYLMSARTATSLCECGYSIEDPADSDVTWVFSDVLETDFTQMEDIGESKDWIRQEFNVSARNGRGKYGKSFQIQNVELDTASNKGDTAGREAGLELHVRGSVSDGSVPSAEIDSSSLDLHWGSYRAGLKLPTANGTCAAFFWYFNDTQEIDLEFLTREFNKEKGVYPISLVIQTPESKEAGYDASTTGTYQRYNLSFDPTADFHEYRFDYLHNRVLFYADSEKIGEMEGDEMPSVGGHLIIQHWSNGNAKWSGGPPEEDSLLKVSYVKAYYNSSESERLEKASKRCNAAGTDDKAICAVPDASATDASDGGHFFSPSMRPDEGDGTGKGEDRGEGESESNEHGGMDQGGNEPDDNRPAADKQGNEDSSGPNPKAPIGLATYTCVAAVAMCSFITTVFV